MTVSELIDLLQRYDNNAEVFMIFDEVEDTLLLPEKVTRSYLWKGEVYSKDCGEGTVQVPLIILTARNPERDER